MSCLQNNFFLFIFCNITKEEKFCCPSHIFPPLPYFKSFSLSGTQYVAPWSLCSGSNTTCHVKGHTNITDCIMQGERGRSRLHSGHFNGTTCTFTPSHSLKLPLQGHGYLWADFSVSIFKKSGICFWDINWVACELLSVSAFSPGEGSSYTANVHKVRVPTQFRKTGFCFSKYQMAATAFGSSFQVLSLLVAMHCKRPSEPS